MPLRIEATNFGKGINRCVYNGTVLVATIHHHPRWAQNGLPDKWNVCWTTGRVDWHSSLAEARDNALKAFSAVLCDAGYCLDRPEPQSQPDLTYGLGWVKPST